MYKKGDVVLSLVECPDGLIGVDVKNKIGVIIDIERRPDGDLDFTVDHPQGGTYIYGIDQLRYVKTQELADFAMEMLRKVYAKARG